MMNASCPIACDAAELPQRRFSQEGRREVMHFKVNLLTLYEDRASLYN